MEADEYEEMRYETVKQLEEFQSSLDNISNVTLKSDLERFKQAVTAAIAEAFRTPEVIRFFTRKEPGQLRLKLEQIEREHTFRQIDDAFYSSTRLEILLALKKLGEKLDTTEEVFLRRATAASEILQKIVQDDSEEDKIASSVSGLKK
ncbi:protein LZIC-like [Symsagittifera roscoffensis]|uniref:protein LZIC-like n=1 Tax=Symsagittifera roscoffensis TaxID=84072 RepID=UPI00307C820A